MTDTEKKDETKLPVEVEASIALNWSDNPAAAQMTRTVARAMLGQNVSVDKVREIIQNSGRLVD